MAAQQEGELLVAAGEGDLPKVAALLAAGADPDGAPGATRHCPIHLAARCPPRPQINIPACVFRMIWLLTLSSGWRTGHTNRP